MLTSERPCCNVTNLDSLRTCTRTNSPSSSLEKATCTRLCGFLSNFRRHLFHGFLAGFVRGFINDFMSGVQRHFQPGFAGGFLSVLLVTAAIAGGALFYVPAVSAQTLEAGTEAVPFLNIVRGARTAALGGTGTADDADPTAIFLNPANLPGGAAMGAVFEYHRRFQGIRQHLLAVSGERAPFRWGVGAAVLRVGDIERRGEYPTEEPLDIFSATDIVAGVAGAYRLAGFLDVGLKVKGIFEKIYTSNAFGFAVDTGLSADLSHTLARLKLGLAAANLGPDMGFESGKHPLPRQLRAGVALYPRTAFLAEGSALLVDVVREHGETRGSFGVEVSPYPGISLRYGLGVGFDTRDHAFGLGFWWASWAFDYAYVPYSMNLGEVHQIGIKYRL